MNGSPALLVRPVKPSNLNGNNNLTTAFTFNGAIVVNGNSFSANLNGPLTLTGTFKLLRPLAQLFRK